MLETIALIALAIVYVGVGIALIVIGTRMRSGKVLPNGIVGTRTEFSMQSEENWYFAQRLTGAPTRWIGYSMFLWIPAFIFFKSTNSDGLLYLTIAVQLFLIILFWIIYFIGTERYREKRVKK
ncbi:SdpI family protein [Arcanobacterium phocae]|uniref:SdpI family protein n=2 Tax=Arcanobacterium phocae TaxID=131112 RepID=UPI001C0EFCB3|nr:SdpI family protein [Arcanobacterium phocae]